MNPRIDAQPESGPALMDSHREALPELVDPQPRQSSLGLDDLDRGDRVGPGPEEYRPGPGSARNIPHYRFGPQLLENGVRFRLFAPAADEVDLLIDGRAPIRMDAVGDGWHSANVDEAGPGTLYRFRALGIDFPDPASRVQEDDTDGWSRVRAAMPPASPRAARSWHEAQIVELHVGTATPEGTFAALERRLDHFAAAGYTAIELMPIAAFPGANNWGYDGVLHFAPDRSYGTPEELRSLVDAAHALGMAVMLDVVYNHFGPVDNFLSRYAPSFFDENVHTPWGAGLNFRDDTVRLFFLENVRLWLEDYDMDGLRLDAVMEYGTHEGAQELKRQIAAMARAIKPNALLALENIESAATWLARDEAGRPLHYDAIWNDDLHNALHVLTTGQESGYYGMVADDPVGVARLALAHGTKGKDDPEGSPAVLSLPPSAFVTFVQNHDHIGNQPDGRRLTQKLDAERLDFLHFVILLAPQIPMFFMGEEAHVRTPFPFFGDIRHHLDEEIRTGRREFTSQLPWPGESLAPSPDPVSEETPELAQLDWDAIRNEEHRGALARFRELSRLRRDHVWPLLASPYRGSDSERDESVVCVRWHYGAGTLVMILNASPSDASIALDPLDTVASTGTIRRDGDRIRLGPWSAAISVLPETAAADPHREPAGA